MNEEEERAVYRLTPKGYIATNLMNYFKITPEEADELASKIEDDIFIGGYVYIHHSRIRRVNDKGEPLDG